MVGVLTKKLWLCAALRIFFYWLVDLEGTDYVRNTTQASFQIAAIPCRIQGSLKIKDLTL